MKKTFLLISTFISISIHAQTFFTKNARVSFYSAAPLERIEAHNKKGVGIMKAKSGTVEFSVLLKGFEFEKALMQEHFNENYVESDKYPKATFKGIIRDNVTWTTDGVYKTMITGIFSLHGVSKTETAPAIITVKNGVVSATSEFKLTLSDYRIKIPSVVSDKISKTVTVAVSVGAFSTSNN
jgi:hypothetical protein